ncbi:group II truncated hemoglobin [Zhengella sp. ZM62]|uniref:group II truncated hemoglobin n=1 Tax=Zhengella sedimenti TaxID=3390035 RepID=UPI003975E52B
MTEKTSLYEAIGGKPAVERLTARFYALMDTLPEAKATRDIHPADLAESEEKFTEYLMMWLGGPQTFIEKRGAPMLRRRHLPFGIGTAEIEGWLACFRQALDETVPQAQLRDVIWQNVERLGHHMRNREG